MTELPTGLLTFLFTDIEGSTPRWESGPDEMQRALERHDEIIQKAVSGAGGQIFKHTGDGVGAVFTSPRGAAEAALDAQASLQADDWDGAERLLVRMGIHVGESEPHRGDYLGPAVNRSARIMDVANGDQIVISAAAAELLSGLEIRPEGPHQLRGIGTERLFRLTAEALHFDDRPLRSRVGSSTNGLPTPVHRLIGRETELEAIAGLLADHSMVTVVGPGGVGKSRFVVDVGRAAQQHFPDGVVMCELSPVGDGEAVADAVAEALGARVQPDLSLENSIVHFLEHRRLLLILDSCEHVVGTVRDLTRRILTVDGPVVLATSREPIGVEGEQLYGLAPLDPGTAGVQLFKERAAERDAHFAPRAGDEDLIAQICSKVDGVPLAVELAAAWVRVLSLDQLLEQLDDRFRILRGGQRGGRHETLRDTIRWSYEQLDERQAALFSRLSIFAGGFSLDAVQEVCADELVPESELLDLVMALVDKSMVITERGVGHIRFRMLGTLRQFGQEQLDLSGDSSLSRRRHAEHFGALAAAQSAALLTDKEAEVWDLLGREWANIRAALETKLADDDVDSAAELVVAVSWFAVFSMRFEAFAWAHELLGRVPPDHPRLGALSGIRAMEAYFTVDENATPLAERGLAIDPVDPEGFCRASLAAVYLNNVHSAEDSAALTEAWLEHEQEGGPVSEVWAHGFRTFHLVTHDPTPEASVHADGLHQRAVRSGSATTMALAKWAQGMVVAVTDRDQAMQTWDEGLDAARSLNPRHLVQHIIIGLQLNFTAYRGELRPTLLRCRDALQLAYDQHYLVGTSHLFGVTAIVLARSGRAETGAQLLGAMEANGHIPRGNAIHVIGRELGAEAEQYAARGADLSINDAAGIAMEALTAAIEEQST